MLMKGYCKGSSYSTSIIEKLERTGSTHRMLWILQLSQFERWYGRIYLLGWINNVKNRIDETINHLAKKLYTCKNKDSLSYLNISNGLHNIYKGFALLQKIKQMEILLLIVKDFMLLLFLQINITNLKAIIAR